jgi:hypothetical protein
MTLNTEAFAKALAAGIAAYEEAVVANSDGWIGWSGGEVPLKDDDYVEIRLRCHETNKGGAGSFDWSVGVSSPSDFDIIAYRLAQ